MNSKVKEYLKKELRNFKNLDIDKIYPYFEYIADLKTSIDTFSRVSEKLISKIEELSQGKSIDEVCDQFCIITELFEPFIKKVSWVIYGKEIENDFKDTTKFLGYYLIDKMGIEYRLKKSKVCNFDETFHNAYELRDTQAHTAKSWTNSELMNNIDNILYGFLYIVKVNLPKLEKMIGQDELNKNKYDNFPILNWKSILVLDRTFYFDMFTFETMPKKIEIVNNNSILNYDKYGKETGNADDNNYEVACDKHGNILRNQDYSFEYVDGALSVVTENIKNECKEILKVFRMTNEDIELEIKWCKWGTIKLYFNKYGKMLQNELISNLGYEKYTYNYVNDVLISRKLDSPFKKCIETAEISDNQIIFREGNEIVTKISYNSNHLIESITTDGDVRNYRFIY